MIQKKGLIIVIILGLLLLAGCNKKDDQSTNTINPNEIIQHIASVNFDNYIENSVHKSLKEITKDTELSEPEKVLYNFLVALNSKNYNEAMKLSNYHQLSVTEEDFKNGLSSNDNASYNYASIVSRDLSKGIKVDVSPIDDTKDIMVSYVLIDDKYEYDGALVKINDDWKVVVSGLSECLFEIPTGNKLIIDSQEIDELFKVASQDNKDLYRLLFLSNTTHTINGKCIDYAPSGNLGNSNDIMNFQLVCTDKEVEDFIKWELDFYNSLYKDAYEDNDLTKYFTNDDIIQSVKQAIADQKSKNISDIVITNISPTKHANLPFKYIDTDTIEANIAIIFSYKYLDSDGNPHIKDGIIDTCVSAIFKKDKDTWKMDKILREDPILTNSKF